MTDHTSQYLPLPQPDEIPLREKEDAMGAYFMMFAALAVGIPFPLLNLIAAIIYLYLNKNKSRFVHFHALQSLYSQIPVTILNAGLVTWVIINLAGKYEFTDEFTGYAIMTGIGNLIYLIFSLIAAAKAHKGLFYYFIFFGRMAYHRSYLNRPARERKLINLPPKV
jgi:uncharacterized membrane protein